ncbi:MAG: hypothetical protein ACYC4L_06320 [Chloroflexota bacterium]
MSDPKERFAGFPARGLSFTPLPDLFFARLLPGIDDLNELKVTLHLFWLTYHQKGTVRVVRQEELLADRTLLAGLGDVEPAEALSAGLERAVSRGTVLHLALEDEGTVDSLYCLNTGEGRRTIAGLKNGSISPPARPRLWPVAVRPARSPSLALWEKQIGLLSPVIASEITEAESLYGAAAVVAAIDEALRRDKPRWPYIKRVLENRQRRAGGVADDGQTS